MRAYLFILLTSVHDTMSSSTRSSDTITKIDPSMQKTIDTIRDVAMNATVGSAAFFSELLTPLPVCFSLAFQLLIVENG